MAMTRRRLLAAFVGLAGILGGRALTAQEEPRFYLTGFVQSPGVYAFREGLTVRQAIALAGGINENGSLRRIVIKRRVDGQGVEIEASLNTLVQPNDVVHVPRRLQ